MKKSIYLLSLFLILLYSCEEEENKRPFGSFIEVPAEVETIQAAVDIAQPFDTILLEDREYMEWNIEVTKPLLITSKFYLENDTNLIDQTVINASSESRVFTISDISDTLRIDGITMMNGSAIKADGGGVHCTNANLKMSNSVVKNNIASGGSYMIGDGGGMYINESYVMLENVKILDNEATGWCGGVFCSNSEFYANNLSIERSNSWGEPVTIWFGDSYINISNSEFTDNPANMEGYYGIGFTRCDGILEKVKIINNTANLRDSNVDVIDCEIEWVE